MAKSPIKNTSSPAFRAPGDADWRDLTAPKGDDNQKKQAQRNHSELSEALLGSLQMQNLVVLAGSGCSYSAGGPSMGDLWKNAVGEPPNAQAKAVAAKVHARLDQKNIEEFLSRIEAYLQVADDAEVEEFLHRCKKSILDDCSGFLDPDRLAPHRTFLHRLSRRRVRDQRLKVFTTNYDLCFECAAGELGGVVLDGFSFTQPRRYDPRFFGYDIIRRSRGGDGLGDYLEGVFLLYKLHGSVNWERGDPGQIFEVAKPDPSAACLIYPASGKFQQSFTQPHLESMAQYLAAVREPNTCVVVVGFGFNDEHLSAPLLAAAQTNPHLRVIVVTPSARTQATDGNEFWTELGELSAQGDDVWFIASDFQFFSQMIPDLKSLTPANMLMKAVQNVTRER